MHNICKFYISNVLQEYKFVIDQIYKYVGCSGSSCNLVIKGLNIDINLSFFHISQVGINELTSRS